MIKLKPKIQKEYYFGFLKKHIDQLIEEDILLAKTTRCEAFKRKENINPTFLQNTYKEDLILKNVKTFEKNFKQNHPESIFYLTPKNECGVEKFISTTIRAKKTKHNELSEYKRCIIFLSNFVKYEELEDPLKPPEFAVSPYNITRWKVGDSLDMAILNVSLLIGSGYNAYIVMGYASQEITSKNESNLDYNFEKDFEEEDVTIDIEDEKLVTDFEKNVFFIETPQKIESEIEVQKKKKILKKTQIKESKNIINDDEPERLEEDLFNGRRIHFWILIKKDEQRKVKNNYFIDPATGTSFEVNSWPIPFFRIVQIFNNRNVWINKNQSKSINDLNVDDFQTDEENWISVLKNDSEGEEEKKVKISRTEIEENEPDLEKEHKALLLDRPLSWVPNFEISQDIFIQESKNSKFSRFYKKLQIDYYCEYQQSDGLVQKITKFSDYKRLIVNEVTYLYKNRKDNLYKKQHFPYEFRSIDYYKNNTQNFQQNNNWPHWKEIETISSIKRIIRFYSLRFKDGLIKREEIIGKKTNEYYENRDDKLIYTSVSFEKNEGDVKKNTYSFVDRNIGSVNIIKMVQKFEKNPLIEANEQISKFIVDLRRQRITVSYHLDENQISPIEYTISRDEFTGISSNNSHNIDKDISMTRKKEIYNLEKECYSKIKYSEKSMEDDFKKYKFSFEQKIEKLKDAISLKKSVNEDDKFNILIESNYMNKKKKKKEVQILENDSDDLFNRDDVIAQNLKEKGLLGKKMDKETIDNVKIEIINNFQNRYFERSEIMSQRFEEEKNKVLNLEKIYQRKTNENIGKEEEKEFEKELYNFNLKLSILEQRLFNFSKTAYEKYEELQKKINEDPRLKYDDDN